MTTMDLCAQGDRLAFTLQPQPDELSAVEEAVRHFARDHALSGTPAAPWQIRLELGGRSGYAGLPRGIVLQAFEAASRAATGASFKVVLDHLTSVRTLGGWTIALRGPSPQQPLLDLRDRLVSECQRAGLANFTMPGWEPQVLVHDHHLTVPTSPVAPLVWSATSLALVHVMPEMGRQVVLGAWPFSSAP